MTTLESTYTEEKNNKELDSFETINGYKKIERKLYFAFKRLFDLFCSIFGIIFLLFIVIIIIVFFISVKILSLI